MLIFAVYFFFINLELTCQRQERQPRRWAPPYYLIKFPNNRVKKIWNGSRRRHRTSINTKTTAQPITTMHLLQISNMSSGVSGGGNPGGGVRQHVNWQFFAKNYMKMKETGQRGAESLASPFIRPWCLRKHATCRTLLKQDPYKMHA